MKPNPKCISNSVFSVPLIASKTAAVSGGRRSSPKNIFKQEKYSRINWWFRRCCNKDN